MGAPAKYGQGFYKGIGSIEKGIASILGKAKRLKCEGASMLFQEVSIQGMTYLVNPTPIAYDIEI